MSDAERKLIRIQLIGDARWNGTPSILTGHFHMRHTDDDLITPYWHHWGKNPEWYGRLRGYWCDIIAGECSSEVQQVDARTRLLGVWKKLVAPAERGTL